MMKSDPSAAVLSVSLGCGLWFSLTGLLRTSIVFLMLCNKLLLALDLFFSFSNFN